MESNNNNDDDDNNNKLTPFHDVVEEDEMSLSQVEFFNKINKEMNRSGDTQKTIKSKEGAILFVIKNDTRNDRSFEIEKILKESTLLANCHVIVVNGTIIRGINSTAELEQLHQQRLEEEGENRSLGMRDVSSPFVSHTTTTITTPPRVLLQVTQQQYKNKITPKLEKKLKKQEWKFQKASGRK